MNDKKQNKVASNWGGVSWIPLRLVLSRMAGVEEEEEEKKKKKQERHSKISGFQLGGFNWIPLRSVTYVR